MFHFSAHVVANQRMSRAIIESLLAHPERLTGVEFGKIVMHLRMVYGNVTGVPSLAQTSKAGNNLFTARLLDELLVSPAIFHSQVRVFLIVCARIYCCSSFNFHYVSSLVLAIPHMYTLSFLFCTNSIGRRCSSCVSCCYLC